MPPVSDIASLLVVAVAVTFIGWAMVYLSSRMKD
jgi:hypothetical protein